MNTDKANKQVQLVELEVLDDVDKLAGAGDAVGVLPTGRLRILVRYLAVLYMDGTLDVLMRCRGTSGLWILSCPKNLGHVGLEGLRL